MGRLPRLREGGIVEVTLYDRSGRPTAYIEMENDHTVYLWDGSPVAYTDGDNVYGFNGRHLGWFEQGILYDRYGQGIGFTSESCPSRVSSESPKGQKKVRPGKSGTATPPMKPVYDPTASDDDLTLFLRQGR